MKKFGDNDFIIFLLYVDDMLIVGHDAIKIENLKKKLSKSFAMKDLGLAKQILGMKIFRDIKFGKLWLSQVGRTKKLEPTLTHESLNKGSRIKARAKPRPII